MAINGRLDEMIAMLRDKEVRRAIITDGLSKTILLCETSGRPVKWELGKLVATKTITGSRWRQRLNGTIAITKFPQQRDDVLERHELIRERLRYRGRMTTEDEGREAVGRK